MLENTKYIKNGIECCMCPFQGDVTISQFAYADFSHKGATAIDVIDGANKSPYYAPATVECIEINTQYCFTWWRTVNEVYLADGSIGHATFMLGHDESINCYVGQVVEQGVQLGNMGAGGNATGVHCHIECAKGHQSGWVANAYGIYVLPNASLIETICFMDDTNFLNADMSDMHYTSEIADNPAPTPTPTPEPSGDILNEIPSDFNYETGTFTASVDEIRIRRAPSLNGALTGDWYNSGMAVNYDGFVRREGYLWISYIGSDSTRRWMATGETDGNGVNASPWGSFQ